MRQVRVFAMMTAVAIAAMTAGIPTAVAQQTPASHAAIRVAVDHYFKGHATGDGSHFAKVFHPDAKLFWIGPDGSVMQRTAADYIKGASGTPALDDAQRTRRIVSIDVTGTAAMVKVELDYPTAKFTDYFSMVERKGEWWIVNKTYHVQRK
jgi:hypothetical protein